MSSRNSFSKLTKDISAERRAYIEVRKIDLREEMELAELRQAIGMSQDAMTKQVGVQQPAITLFEKHKDIRISCLTNMIEAMGGTLEIKAHFREGDVIISNDLQPIKAV